MQAQNIFSINRKKLLLVFIVLFAVVFSVFLYVAPPIAEADFDHEFCSYSGAFWLIAYEISSPCPGPDYDQTDPLDSEYIECNTITQGSDGLTFECAPFDEFSESGTECVCTLPPPPSVNLTSATNNIIEGDPLDLVWAATNATSCYGNGVGGFSGSVGLNGPWALSTSLSAGTYVFGIYCEGPGGTYPLDRAVRPYDTRTITINAVAPPPTTCVLGPALLFGETTLSDCNAAIAGVPSCTGAPGDTILEPIPWVGCIFTNNCALNRT